MMSTSISPLRAMEGLNPPDNITNEAWSEFLALWLNKTLSNLMVKNQTQNETNTDECMHYCEHNIRDFFTNYRLYHGYITLVVSIAYEGGN